MTFFALTDFSNLEIHHTTIPSSLPISIDQVIAPYFTGVPQRYHC